MVICLGRGACLHMAQLMPLTLTILCSSKSRLVLPFWYQLIWVVQDKWPVNGVVADAYETTPAVALTYTDE